MKHNIHSANASREGAVKNLLLAQDHLVVPKNYCKECIDKHLSTAEAFEEEASTLENGTDKDIGYAILIGKLKEQVDEKPINELIKNVRLVRKKIHELIKGNEICPECTSSLIELRKALKRSKSKINNMVEISDLIEIGAGILLGKGIQEGTRSYLKGELFGLPTPTVVNSLVGLGAVGGSLLDYIPGRYQLVASIGGMQLLLEEIVTSLKGAIPAKAVAPAFIAPKASVPGPAPAITARYF